jgi:hypothetical protein
MASTLMNGQFFLIEKACKDKKIDIAQCGFFVMDFLMNKKFGMNQRVDSIIFFILSIIGGRVKFKWTDQA